MVDEVLEALARAFGEPANAIDILEVERVRLRLGVSGGRVISVLPTGTAASLAPSTVDSAVMPKTGLTSGGGGSRAGVLAGGGGALVAAP